MFAGLQQGAVGGLALGPGDFEWVRGSVRARMRLTGLVEFV